MASATWGFRAEPNPELNGRSLSMSMGKVLGGGSSINAQLWARGHKTDWDLFASEALLIEIDPHVFTGQMHRQAWPIGPRSGCWRFDLL